MQQLPLNVVMNGLYRATQDAATMLNPPVDAKLILCFLRHRHPDSEVLINNPSLPPAQPNEALHLLRALLPLETVPRGRPGAHGPRVPGLRRRERVQGQGGAAEAPLGQPRDPGRCQAQANEEEVPQGTGNV